MIPTRPAAPPAAVALSRAAALAVLLAGGAAQAESVVRPGTTLGLATASPDPVGLYFLQLSSVGLRETRPAASLNNANVPAFLWSTPWSLADGRLELIAALPVVVEREADGLPESGVSQGFLAARLNWDLGGDVGVSYLLGGYFPNATAFLTRSPSLSHRFAVSYTGDGWNLTGNLLYGHILGGPIEAGSVVPDYLNLDVTATREFGSWEVGAVAFASTDLPTGAAGGRLDGQIAAGGLLGYDFGPARVQAYVTRDVAQRNYGGRETRGWLRVVVPIDLDPPKAASSQPPRRAPRL